MKLIRMATGDERTAVQLFETIRWGGCPACPRCGSTNVRQIMSKDGQREKHYRWRCKDCVGTARQFSVRTGSVLEETRLPLTIWAHAYWRASASKKGVSALQLARECSIRHQTALFLLNRIRWGMRNADAAKLTGTCEADEVYIGGRPRPKHLQPTWGNKLGRKGKYLPVVAVVQRDGPVRAQPMAKVTGENVRQFLLANVNQTARLMTDEASVYTRAGKLFSGGHQTVYHTRHEYVRGDVTTNRAESFFALFRRKLHGTHHAVSQEHLFRYLDEAAFLFNTRKANDDERVRLAIKAGDGKRLMYRDRPSAAA